MTNPTVDPLDEVALYDFELPRELIAQHPVEHRIDARLMLIDRQSGSIDHHYVRDLPEILQPTDVLVLNDSKVIPAKLVGERTSTGGKWEGLFLREDDQGIWEILSKTRGHLTVDETISLRDKEGRVRPALRVVAKLENGHLAVRPLEDSTSELLETFGRVPLPPYIRDGQMVDSDVAAYQTIYAKTPGSVAAPTAGLHFTKDLIQTLQAKGVGTAPVTLHVGLGTFRPVATQRLSEHQMHVEYGELTQRTAERLNQHRQRGGRILAVGTTSTRVLESAARDVPGFIDSCQSWSGETDIFIRPPYEFQVVDVLMTNFHLPKSTLMALVSAFAGRELIMKAYAEAIEQRYRFYSYGDCMLIL